INKGKNFYHHEEMYPEPEVVKPLLKPLLRLSNREFKEKFGHLAGAWRGKKPIQRNAIIALAHFKDESAIDCLGEILLEDKRTEMRGTAAWALGKIGGEQAKALLNKAMEKEEDEEVLNELIKSLQSLNE